MDDNRYFKYYRPSGFSYKTLVHYFLQTDRYLRTQFDCGPTCGAFTLITCFLVCIIFAYTLASRAIFLLSTKKFQELQQESDKKLPRKQSILQVRPAFSCVSKHLCQGNIFLDKTKKYVQKEQLEVELMNSRINNMTRLLNQEKESQWQDSVNRSRNHRNTRTRSKN